MSAGRGFGRVVFMAIAVRGAALLAHPLPEKVAKLEARGDLKEARRQLEAATDKDDLEHRALLDDAIRAEAIAEAYRSRRLYAPAQQALEPTLAKLNATRDVHLVLHLQELLDRVRPRPEDREAAQATLAGAERLHERKAYKRARELYESVAKDGPDPVGREEWARARQGAARSARAEIEAEPLGFIDETLAAARPGASMLAKWSLLGGLLLVGFVLIDRLRRVFLMKPGTVIELTDLTVAGDARPAANRELNERLVAAIESIVKAGRGMATLEASVTREAGGTDETPVPSYLAFVDPALEAPELAKFGESVQAATPAVQIGPLGFNPQQLWSLARWAFTPTFRHVMTGTLSQSDGNLVLHVTRVDRKKNQIVDHWRAMTPLAAGRGACLVDIAAQMVLAGKEAATITANCQSLRHYVASIDALAAGDKADMLETARNALQAALVADPLNWLARFHLAVVLRKLGESLAAARHLTFLSEDLAGAPPPSLKTYVRRSPDFDYVVQYHLASAYAQSGQPRDLYAAGLLFDLLIALPTTLEGAALRMMGRLHHLEMLGRSGDSSLQAARVLAIRDNAARRKAGTEVVTRLRSYLQWFDAHARELEEGWPADHALARGVLLHALGRIEYALGERRQAVQALTEASAFVPRFPDVFVDLAEVYLERKSPEDWPRRVMTLLDRALAIDKAHAKAHHVYGRFYLTNAGRDLTRAEEHLRDGPPDPGGLFMYAQVLHAQGHWAKAIERLDRAMAIDKAGPTFRVRLYGYCVRELAREGAPPKRLRRLAWSYREHMKTVTNPRESEKLQEVLKEIEELIAKLEAPAAGPPPPPPPVPPPPAPEPPPTI